MGFRTRASVSQTTRFKRSSSTRKLVPERDVSSPPAAPFNSTAFLIRQRSEHREELNGSPPLFAEFDQYGSNSKNMVVCCSFAADNHDRGCSYQSLAPRPVVIGLSTQRPGNHSSLHLELQALQISDSPHEERSSVARLLRCPHLQRHRSRNGASSAERSRKVEDPASAAHENGRDKSRHRRLRSCTDDNFDILQLDASANLNLEDLRNNFQGLGI